jgi:hypothetical protein
MLLESVFGTIVKGVDQVVNELFGVLWRLGFGAQHTQHRQNVAPIGAYAFEYRCFHLYTKMVTSKRLYASFQVDLALEIGNWEEAAGDFAIDSVLTSP